MDKRGRLLREDLGEAQTSAGQWSLFGHDGGPSTVQPRHEDAYWSWKGNDGQ